MRFDIAKTPKKVSIVLFQILGIFAQRPEKVYSRGQTSSRSLTGTLVNSLMISFMSMVFSDLLIGNVRRNRCPKKGLNPGKVQDPPLSLDVVRGAFREPVISEDPVDLSINGHWCKTTALVGPLLGGIHGKKDPDEKRPNCFGIYPPQKDTTKAGGNGGLTTTHRWCFLIAYRNRSGGSCTFVGFNPEASGNNTRS